MIALVVTMTATEGRAAALLDAVREQAAASLREEPGCTRFDVCVDVEDERRIVLYELYVDEEAFDAHRETAHFARWAEARDANVAELERVKATVAEPL